MFYKKLGRSFGPVFNSFFKYWKTFLYNNSATLHGIAINYTQQYETESANRYDI